MIASYLIIYISRVISSLYYIFDYNPLMRFYRTWTLNRHTPRCLYPKQAHVLIFFAALVYRFSSPIILGWQVIERVSSKLGGGV